MTCDTCKELISDYLDGRLHSTQRRELEAHVRTCPRCATALRGVRMIRNRLAGLDRKHLPDTFTFRMRRLLLDEVSREGSWPRRLRETLRPSPETTRAALVGTVAAVTSFIVLWTLWGPSSVETDRHDDPVAAVGAGAQAQSVRYVLEHVQLQGDPIEWTASEDSTVRSTREVTPPVGARSVSASF